MWGGRCTGLVSGIGSDQKNGGTRVQYGCEGRDGYTKIFAKHVLKEKL